MTAKKIYHRIYTISVCHETVCYS